MKSLFIISKKDLTKDLFLSNELNIINQFFDQIYIYPINFLDDSSYTDIKIKNIPNQTFVSVVPLNRKFYLFLAYLNLIIEVLWEEFNKKKLSLSIKEFFPTLRRLLKNIDRSEVILLDLKKLDLIGTRNEVYYYPFWGEEEAFCLALLKRKNHIKNLFIRLRGWDLFEERRENNYIPFQRYIFRQASLISVQTQEAYNYLLAKYPWYADKIVLNYQGTYDHGENPYDEDKTCVRIVSCSNLVPLKRVDRIITILKEVDCDIEWIHFGDGEERKKLLDMAASLPTNIKFHFKGRVGNQEILEFYKNQSVDLFIHLSSTEGGVPLALQEAASFGIPMIGTNAGGIPEIVINGKTGLLVPIEFENKVIADFINGFKTSSYATRKQRQKVKAYWRSHFMAVENYKGLANQILKIDSAK